MLVPIEVEAGSIFLSKIGCIYMNKRDACSFLSSDVWNESLRLLPKIERGGWRKIAMHSLIRTVLKNEYESFFICY